MSLNLTNEDYSGSIAIACHDLGFDLTGCELDPEYFAAMSKRIDSHTAQTSIFNPKTQ